MNTENEKVVLVIEGSENLRNFGREVLRENFHVVTTDNGVEGLAIAREIYPELVLCDVSVKELGGVEICQILKSDEATSHLSFILLGPAGSAIEEIKGLNAGADDYIPGAFDREVLGLKIKNTLRLRKSLRRQYLQELPESVETSDQEGPLLEKIRQLISDNISDPNFGVNQVSFQIGISVSVLYRKLRLLTGITVHDFVKSIRMKKAMQLLEGGTYQVNEVASAVGYEDSKYFSKEFRKTFGKTPMDIKRSVSDVQ